MSDEIVDEIRATRQRIFAECGGDIHRLMERLKAAEAQDQSRLVTEKQVRERAERGAVVLPKTSC